MSWKGVLARAMKKTIWVVVVVAIIGGVVLLLGSRRKSDPKYRTAKVDRGDVTQTVTATGALSAMTTVKVGSQVSGIIAKLHSDFNGQVKKGDLLAELDPTPFQEKVAANRAALDKAVVEMRNSEISLRRQAALQKEGLSPQADFDSAKAAYNAARAAVAQAQAALNQANTDLRNSKIVAPIDGVVVDRQYDVGQTVAASFQAPTLFTIAQDLTKMQVSADVSESDIGQIKVGERVRFTVDAFPEREFRGKVSQIRLNATVNQNVVTYPVIVEVDNTDLLLRPTMTANVSLDVATVRNVLRIPNAALRWKPEEKSTTSVEERAAQVGSQRGTAAMAGQFAQTGGGGGRSGGTARMRPQTVYELPTPDAAEPKPVEVRTGITNGRFTQVVSGDLKPGMSVVVGLATTKVDASRSLLGAPAGPGGGRRGF